MSNFWGAIQKRSFLPAGLESSSVYIPLTKKNDDITDTKTKVVSTPPLLSLSKEMKQRIGPLPVEFSEKKRRNQHQHI